MASTLANLLLVMAVLGLARGAPVIAGRAAQLPFEQPAKAADISIAHLGGDLLGIQRAVLQQAHGRLQTQPLQIVQRTGAESLRRFSR